jgi:ATP-binding cassette subfamily B protein
VEWLQESVLRFLLWALRGLERQILSIFALGCAIGVTDVLSAFLIGWLLNEIVAAGVSSESLRALAPQIVLTVALFTIIKPGLQAAEIRWKLVHLMPNVIPVIGQRLFDRLLAQPTARVTKADPGRLSHKILRTADVTSGLLTDVLNAFSVLVGTLVATGFLLLRIEPAFFVFLGVWTALAIANTAYFVPRLRQTSSKRAEATTELTGGLVDSLSNLRSVKLFGNEGHESAAAGQALDQLRTANSDFGARNANFRIGLFFLTGILPIGLQGGAIYTWWLGITGPGEVAMLGLVAARVATIANTASLAMMLIYRNLGEIEHGMTLFTNDETSARSHPTSPQCRARSATAGEIRFENVSFTYPQSGFGLHDISITIPEGSLTAIVGPSGSGKSTLISLLLGLDIPNGGTIRIGNRPLGWFSPADTAQTFALAGQSEVPFNRTLEENVRYGRLDAPDDQVRDVIETAGLSLLRGEGHDAARRLGPGGRGLSGGQRQRVLIARALLRDPPVLILDEATSALDYPAEQELLRRIATHRKGRTTIIITHRPSALPEIDQVIAIEAGRIVESGPLKTLTLAARYFSQSESTGGI